MDTPPSYRFSALASIIMDCGPPTLLHGLSFSTSYPWLSISLPPCTIAGFRGRPSWRLSRSLRSCTTAIYSIASLWYSRQWWVALDCKYLNLNNTLRTIFIILKNLRGTNPDLIIGALTALGTVLSMGFLVSFPSANFFLPKLKYSS